ncbi:hypothetical protein BHM03_00047943 [Ensete ventricosum]|nr:hypothetical protein BHM03_00047943 [Ensete ventricosum]
MHPLRFPNSGIRAFVQKIGFKLRVMRLNCIESFYAFAARIARRRGGQQQPAPHAGSATHDQTGCKGQPAEAKAPCKGAVGNSQSPLQGQPLAGTAAREHGCPWLGLPPARTIAGRSDHQQGQRPRKVVPPTRKVPPEGSSAAAYAGQRQRRKWGQARASF